MSDIVENKNFQERMKERIKDSIGELLTDDELSEIVKRSMEEIFFKPIKLKDGYKIKEQPPFIYQLIKELLQDKVKEQISIFINNNEDKIISDIKNIIQQGAGVAIMKAITSKFDGDMFMLQQNIISKFQNNNY